MAEPIRSSAWVSGFRARQVGIGKSDCPFATGSLARRHWLAGWNIAAKEAREHDELLDDKLSVVKFVMCGTA